ncbi:MAG: hypothetical protein J6R26_08390 [Paludibacteraceae bacterium]|nr:hypothetical protein [Paludibacteraceae bacterium]
MFPHNKSEKAIQQEKELLAAIEPTLLKIKQLMVQKSFKHFYIPDQFNYDATIDDYFEPEIWDDDKNLFASYSHHEAVVLLTVDGIYLGNDELRFDIVEHYWLDWTKEEGQPIGRMSVKNMVEQAVTNGDDEYSLKAVLEFYVELLNRYDHENAYIENPVA